MEVYYSHSEEETLTIGRRIGQQLRPPFAILLFGELGSGKTVLTRGLVRGMGVDDPSVVHSPTFTLVNEYTGRWGPIHHIDLYRLESLRDLYSIGLDEILVGQDITIIEWAEKLLIQPQKSVSIHIFSDPVSEIRRFEFSQTFREQSDLER